MQANHGENKDSVASRPARYPGDEDERQSICKEWDDGEATSNRQL